MANKGFTISDILPLGVSLNLPPFLGNAKQMPPEEVVKMQEIARIRIHKKNFHIWDSIIPMNLFGMVNQMWTVSFDIFKTQSYFSSRATQKG